MVCWLSVSIMGHFWPIGVNSEPGPGKAIRDPGRRADGVGAGISTSGDVEFRGGSGKAGGR